MNITAHLYLHHTKAESTGKHRLKITLYRNDTRKQIHYAIPFTTTPKGFEAYKSGGGNKQLKHDLDNVMLRTRSIIDSMEEFDFQRFKQLLISA